MKKQVLATSDESFETVNERVIIMRDEHHEWCREWCDHHFVLWSNCSRYSGDRGAESPFYENDNGEQVKRPGVVAFPVSVYDHSGLAYSLGSGAGFPDARWDVTPGALFLWTDRTHYEAMSGEGSWSKVTSEQLAKIAAAEIEEMNMDERGCWYGWRAERRIPGRRPTRTGARSRAQTGRRPILAGAISPRTLTTSTFRVTFPYSPKSSIWSATNTRPSKHQPAAGSKARRHNGAQTMKRTKTDTSRIVNGVPRGDWRRIIADNFKKLMNERSN